MQGMRIKSHKNAFQQVRSFHSSTQSPWQSRRFGAAPAPVKKVSVEMVARPARPAKPKKSVAKSARTRATKR